MNQDPERDEQPKCNTCKGYGFLPGWTPSYSNPDNQGGAPDTVECPDCQPEATPETDAARKAHAAWKERQHDSDMGGGRELVQPVAPDGWATSERLERERDEAQCRAAQSELDSLALRVERDALKADFSAACRVAREREEIILRIEAERDRLRAALEEVAITIRNLTRDAQDRRPWSSNAADNLRLVTDAIREALALTPNHSNQ